MPFIDISFSGGDSMDARTTYCAAITTANPSMVFWIWRTRYLPEWGWTGIASGQQHPNACAGSIRFGGRHLGQLAFFLVGRQYMGPKRSGHA
jgi:hypothetical protein